MGGKSSAPWGGGADVAEYFGQRGHLVQRPREEGEWLEASRGTGPGLALGPGQ